MGELVIGVLAAALLVGALVASSNAIKKKAFCKYCGGSLQQGLAPRFLGTCPHCGRTQPWVEEEVRRRQSPDH